MKITLSKYAGFCEGVDRAYNMIKKMASDPKVKKPIFVLGALVHNEDAVKSLEKLGVVTISGKKDFFSAIGGSAYGRKDKIGTLAITAHGMGPEIYDFAKKKNIDLVDTTCPRVIKAQRLAKLFSEKKYQLVIVGEKDHKEVKGIFEWGKKQAQFVKKENDFKKLKLDPKKKIAVISQTTQNQEFVRHAWDVLRKKYLKVEIVDTLCLTTQNRQGEVRKRAMKNDAVVVIGSPTSANSTRLWEISREINPKSYFIERKNQLKKNWFKNCQTIWVTAGASTPKWIIADVIEYLSGLE